MKIVIANDHRGVFAKERIKTIVSQLGHEWIDFGCHDEQPVDYPDLVYTATIEVITNKADRAIFICSTGMGMCIKTCISSIRPDKVQVNTVTRPPAESFAEPVPKELLESLAAQLFECSEVIADYRGVHEKQEFTSQRDDVLTLLKRRPCTVEDIASGLGLHRNEVLKYIEELSVQGKIEGKQGPNQFYYKAVIQ